MPFIHLVSLWMSLVESKAVANPKHGLDVARLTWVWFDLGAQVTDMHANGTFETGKGNSMYLFEQLIARKDAARGRHKHRQEVKFGRGQMHRLTTYLDRALALVEGDVGDAQHLG